MNVDYYLALYPLVLYASVLCFSSQYYYATTLSLWYLICHFQAAWHFWPVYIKG